MTFQITNEAVGPLEIGPVEPESTYVLRQQVLRPHQRVEEMSLDGSEHPDAVAIGAVIPGSGEVVGTAAVSPEEPPADLGRAVPTRPAWRLRSMATRPDLRGTGVGSAVLQAAIEHVSHHGGGLVWCNARVPAMAFYKSAGFISFGEPWEIEEIGPHVKMWRTVLPTPDRGAPL